MEKKNECSREKEGENIYLVWYHDNYHDQGLLLCFWYLNLKKKSKKKLLPYVVYVHGMDHVTNKMYDKVHQNIIPIPLPCYCEC